MSDADLDWADDLAHKLYVKVSERGDVMSYETEDNIRDLLRLVRLLTLRDVAAMTIDRRECGPEAIEAALRYMMGEPV